MGYGLKSQSSSTAHREPPLSGRRSISKWLLRECNEPRPKRKWCLYFKADNVLIIQRAADLAPAGRIYRGEGSLGNLVARRESSRSRSRAGQRRSATDFKSPG